MPIEMFGGTCVLQPRQHMTRRYIRPRGKALDLAGLDLTFGLDQEVQVDNGTWLFTAHLPARTDHVESLWLIQPLPGFIMLSE
jgi:hypothetical protein